MHISHTIVSAIPTYRRGWSLSALSSTHVTILLQRESAYILFTCSLFNNCVGESENTAPNFWVTMKRVWREQSWHIISYYFSNTMYKIMCVFTYTYSQNTTICQIVLICNKQHYVVYNNYMFRPCKRAIIRLFTEPSSRLHNRSLGRGGTRSPLT